MFKKTCRICLAENKEDLLSVSLKSEEDGEVVGMTISEMIYFCSSVEVLVEDELPQKICLECYQKIQVACEIKQECLNSDAILKKRLKDFKLDPFEEIHGETGEEAQYLEVEQLVTPNVSLSDSGPSKSVPEQLPEKQSLKLRKRTTIWPQKCQDCFKIFHNKKEKMSHSSKNLFNQCKKMKEKIFKCYICDDKNFDFLFKKDQHIREYHANDENFVCRICDCVKKSANSLDTHIKYHFRSLEYCCHFCGKIFETAIRLKKHLEGFHNSTKSFVCDLCGHAVKSKMSMKKHLEYKHLNIKNWKCLECGDAYSYTCERVYLQHMYRNHNVEPPIRCPDCNVGFSVPYELKKHKNKFGKCNPPKEYARIIDENNRISWKGAKTVEAAVFSDKKGEIFCKLCGKRFTTTSNLMIHNRVKHRGIFYKCDLCSNEYTCPKGLQQHKQTKHFNIYPFSCEICGKKFPSNRPLLRHKIIHTDIKPFECSQCTKKFNDRGSCGRHIRTVHKNLEFPEGQQITIIQNIEYKGIEFTKK